MTFPADQAIAMKLSALRGIPWSKHRMKRQLLLRRASALREAAEQQPQSLLRRVLRWMTGGR